MSNEEKTKICTRCKREFPATPEYFYRNKGHKGGLDNLCKGCRDLLTKRNHVSRRRVRQAYRRCTEELTRNREDITRYKAQNGLPFEATQFLEAFCNGMAHAMAILKEECPEVLEEGDD